MTDHRYTRPTPKTYPDCRCVWCDPNPHLRPQEPLTQAPRPLNPGKNTQHPRTAADLITIGVVAAILGTTTGTLVGIATGYRPTIGGITASVVGAATFVWLAR